MIQNLRSFILQWDSQNKSRKNVVKDQYVPDVISRIGDFFLSYYNGKYNHLTTYVISPPFILRVFSFLKEGEIYQRVKSSLRYGGLNFVVRCPFQCDKIIIKNNIRVFGLPSVAKRTLKIQGFNRLAEGSEVVGEIEFRNRLIDISSLPINIPQIYDFTVSPPSPWFIEEYIPGSKPTVQSNKALIVGFLEKRLVEFYAIFVRPERLIETLKKLHISFDTLFQFWPSDKADILRRYQLRYWPISICHNDLSLGNMLVHNNELYLLDWETAKENPIAFDYENISKSNLALIDSSIIALEKINRCLRVDESALIPPKIQIALASLIKIVNLEEQKNKRSQYYQFIKGLSYKRAVEQTSDDINGKYKSIMYLLHKIKEIE